MSTRRFAIIGITIVSTGACADADAGRSTGPTAPAEPVTSAPFPAIPSAADGSSAPLVITGVQAFDLGTLPGGTFSTARDINDGGDVVGWSETSSGEIHGFILTGSGMTDIGTLGGDRSRAFAINDLGQVVGASRNALGVEHAFEWSGGAMRDLGAYPPEDDIGSSSAAYGINDLGLVAGNVDLAGVVWDLGGSPNFPPFPPYVRVTDPDPFMPAIAYDVNDVGQAAGTLLAAAQGFRWQGSLEPLAVLGALDDGAFGINEPGQVVGRALLAPPVRYHAVLWPDPSTVVDLGTLGGSDSEAQDVNDDGWVVGNSQTGMGEVVAMVWHADLGMRSLGTLGGTTSRAFGLNASGQIVGESETPSGEVHATLWTVDVAVSVTVDVIPGKVNPGSKGMTPVVILTTTDFDATTVDPQTIELGPDGAGAAHGGGHITDVNGDGLEDLLLHFRTADSGIQCGDAEVSLNGQTFGEDAVTGTDAIATVGCG